MAVIEGGAPTRSTPRGGRSKFVRLSAARLWAAPLWAHAAALAVVLLALLPLMTPEGSFTSDEGAYAIQTQSLSDGRWDYEYRAAEYDPEGDNFPLVLTERGDGRFYPYVKHPAYPLLLRAGTSVAGTVLGLHLVALAGAVGTAVAAWLLAGQLDRKLSRPAFWMAAASPVLVNGFLIWAHAPSAALAGLSLVAAVRIVQVGPRARTVVALAGLLTAGVLLRSEALLFAGAVVAGVAWTVRRRSGTVAAALVGAVVAAPVLLATYAEERWIDSISGGGVTGVAPPAEGTSFLAGRVSGAWHELVATSAFGDQMGLLLAVVGLGAVVGFGWMALRRERPTWSQDLLVGCTIAAVAYGARYLLNPHDPITGLFGAWPLALLGLLLVPWRRVAAEVRMIGLVAALFGAAVLATQYQQGGGLEWGGRFFSPLLVPLAVLATLGLCTALARANPTSEGARRVAAGALAGLTAVLAVLGLATVGGMRARELSLAAAVARHPADVTVTTVKSLPRSGWYFEDDVNWMTATDEDLGVLLADLRAAGVRRVSVLTAGTTPLADISPYNRLESVPEPDIVGRGGQLAILSD